MIAVLGAYLSMSTLVAGQWGTIPLFHDYSQQLVITWSATTTPDMVNTLAAGQRVVTSRGDDVSCVSPRLVWPRMGELKVLVLISRQ